MSEFNIEVQGGSSVRLPTAGKYCEKDIIVTASGGGGDTSELENLIDASGVLGTTDEMATAKDKVEALIDKAQWENFWYEQSEKWTNQFASLFVGATKIPRLNCKNATMLRGTFNSTNAESIDFYINSINAGDINRCFQNNSNLVFMVGIAASNAYNVQYLFGGCLNLKTIQEKLNFQNVITVANMNGVFLNCTALENVSFEEECIKVSITFESKELTVDSAKSIILCLKNYENDDTNGYYNTLTLPVEVWNKLDKEEGVQLPDGTVVGWRSYVEFNLWWNT